MGGHTGAEGVDPDALVGPLDGELLDNGRGGGLGRVVEDLVDALVDNLRRHGRGQDDRALLVARLGPQVGGGLGTSKLAPDVDVVCKRVSCAVASVMEEERNRDWGRREGESGREGKGVECEQVGTKKREGRECRSSAERGGWGREGGKRKAEE